jgi:hypothetical protein
MQQITLFSGTLTVTVSGTAYEFTMDPEELIATLSITSHDRTTGNETTNIYLTSSDGVSTWDIVAFPQIASTGAKIYTARVNTRLLGQNVTSAAPGVAAVDPACLKTDTASTNEGIKTLTAGMVRHGPIGNRIGYVAVCAGTTPITVCSITISMR